MRIKERGEYSIGGATLETPLAEVEGVFKDAFKSKWYSNAEEKGYTQFKSASCKLSVVQAKALSYLHTFAGAMFANNPSREMQASLPYRELAEWESHGGLCIYLGVLATVLHPSFTYHQGYATLHTQDAIARMVFGEKQYDIHAWVTAGDKVLDVTALQFRHSTNVSGMVVGEFPPSLEYRGIDSTSALEHYYADFAAEQGMSVGEWKKAHRQLFKQFR